MKTVSQDPMMMASIEELLHFKCKKLLPAALLTEALLLATNHNLWSLRVELTHLVAPMVVSTITEVWAASVNNTWDSLTSISSCSGPLGWTWRWRLHFWDYRFFPLTRWIITRINLPKLQINRKFPFTSTSSKATWPTNRIYIGNSLLLKFSKIPRSCFQVPVHKIFQLYS